MTGEVAGLGAALTFGVSTVLARRFMVAVTPEAGVLVSIVTNVVVFGTVVLVLIVRGALPTVHPASITLFILGGLAGTLVGRNLSYFSISRLGPTLSTTVRLSNSVFTLVTGYVLLHELPRPWQLAGLVLVTTGLWMSLQTGRQPGPRRPSTVDLVGVVMALGGAAAFALGDTARRFGLSLTPVPVLGALVGASTALVAQLIWMSLRGAGRWPRGAALRRLDLWASAAFNTAAILLIYVGLRHAPVAIVSVLYNLQVLVVLLASPLLLPGAERITRWLAGGTVVALAGTALILLT